MREIGKNEFSWPAGEMNVNAGETESPLTVFRT